MATYTPYSRAEIDFLRRVYPNKGIRDTLKEFNEHFGVNFTESQIKHRCIKFGIKVNYDTKFKKKHEPWNKNMSIKTERPDVYEKYFGRNSDYEHMGFIKKGSPVGTIAIRQGNIADYIKVAEPNTWISKPRYVYEQHFRPLKKGEKVLHLNGNAKDDNPNNLVAVTNAIMVRLAKQGLIFKDGELTRCAVTQQQLLQKIRELENENESKVNKNS